VVTSPVATGTPNLKTSVGGRDAAPGQPTGGLQEGDEDPLPPPHHHQHYHLHNPLILSTIIIPFSQVILIFFKYQILTMVFDQVNKQLFFEKLPLHYFK
jgi:hypothetical protein